MLRHGKVTSNALLISYVTMIILAIICSSMLFIYIVYFMLFLLFYITSIYTCIMKSVILQFVFIGMKTYIQYCFWNVHKLYKSCDYVNIQSIANDCSSK